MNKYITKSLVLLVVVGLGSGCATNFPAHKEVVLNPYPATILMIEAGSTAVPDKLVLATGERGSISFFAGFEQRVEVVMTATALDRDGNFLWMDSEEIRYRGPRDIVLGNINEPPSVSSWTPRPKEGRYRNGQFVPSRR